MSYQRRKPLGVEDISASNASAKPHIKVLSATEAARR